MSEYYERHRGDYGKLTDLAIFEHCLPVEAAEDMGSMYPDQMLATLNKDLQVPVRLPTAMGFDQLKWNVLRWPRSSAALMLGTDPQKKETPTIQSALGTVVMWQDSLHIAGVQHLPNAAAGRVLAGKYVPQTNYDNDTKYRLFRGDIVVAQPELALDNASLAKAAKTSYTYLAHGDNIIERPFVGPAPSHFDGKTERPFDTAGLITQGMIDEAWKEAGMDGSNRPVTFTYFHGDTYIPSFLKMLSRRNRILSQTPHIAPLEGDAHRIVVNGITYELPTTLPAA